jgi:hypothetical protein
MNLVLSLTSLKIKMVERERCLIATFDTSVNALEPSDLAELMEWVGASGPVVEFAIQNDTPGPTQDMRCVILSAKVHEKKNASIVELNCDAVLGSITDETMLFLTHSVGSKMETNLKALPPAQLELVNKAG